MSLRKSLTTTALLTTLLSLPALGQEASQTTIDANQAVSDFLPFEDERDFENATRGRIATLDGDAITGPDGLVYDLTMFDFLEGDAPDTTNPSLWRQSRINAVAGLFEVVPGIYQFRGYDLAAMSFISGKTGWIVIDPLTVTETAAAGLKLLRENVEDLPVTGVIITHSHADHFGGVAVAGLFEK